MGRNERRGRPNRVTHDEEISEGGEKVDTEKKGEKMKGVHLDLIRLNEHLEKKFLSPDCFVPASFS